MLLKSDCKYWLSAVRNSILTLWLGGALIGCTPSYTAYQYNKGLQFVGFSDAFDVKKATEWVLPKRSNLYIAYPKVSPSIKDEYPQLQLKVMQDMAGCIGNYFENYNHATEEQTLIEVKLEADEMEADFLLLVSLNSIEDNYSKHAEVAESNKANTEDDANTTKNARYGKDRIGLSLKVYDVRSRTLLDTLTVQAVDGLWGGHNNHPSELITPALNAMLVRL